MIELKKVKTANEMGEFIKIKKPSFVFTFMTPGFFSSGPWEVSFLSEDGKEAFHYTDDSESDECSDESIYSSMEAVGAKEIDGLLRVREKTGEMFFAIQPEEETEETVQNSFDSWVNLVKTLDKEKFELRFFPQNSQITSVLIGKGVQYAKGFEINGERTFEKAASNFPELKVRDYSEIVSWLNFILSGNE